MNELSERVVNDLTKRLETINCRGNRCQRYAFASSSPLQLYSSNASLPWTWRFTVLFQNIGELLKWEISPVPLPTASH